MQRSGMSIPFSGVPLHAQREWIEELAELGYTDVWSSEADGADGFTPLVLASASISGAKSTASISALGQRALKSAVEFPGPQPRSATRRGCSSSMRANKSPAGRVRSAPKAR